MQGKKQPPEQEVDEDGFNTEFDKKKSECRRIRMAVERKERRLCMRAKQCRYSSVSQS